MRSRLVTGVSCLVLILGACGDDDDGGGADTTVQDTQIADTATDAVATDTVVADTAVADTAAPVDTVAADTADTATPEDTEPGDTADTATPEDTEPGDTADTATPEDTEPGDTADTAAPEDTTPPQDTAPACASRATTLAGGSGQKVVIEAVRFGASTDVAIVRNVSASPVTITSAWQWCSIPDYGGVTAASVTLQPQESMQFTLPIPIGAADELALYHSSTYGSSTGVEAFVQWGSAQSGRVGTAVTAGYWSANADFIAIEAGDDGFIATGAASAAGPGGFESVAPACPLQ